MEGKSSGVPITHTHMQPSLPKPQAHAAGRKQAVKATKDGMAWLLCTLLPKFSIGDLSIEALPVLGSGCDLAWKCTMKVSPVRS